MDTREYNKYKKIVDKYSKAYYKTMSDLFELDDLAQEMWLTILTTKDAYKGTNDAKETTFVIASIQNHMSNMIAREVRRRAIFTEEYDTIEDNVASEDEPTPEETLSLKEQLAVLEGRVSHINNGEFVLKKTVEGFSVREISKLAEKQGISISRATVNRIQHRLQDEFSKLISN